MPRILKVNVFLFFLILAACQNSVKTEDKFIETSVIDSIYQNYTQSQDASKSYPDRLHHIDKAYYLGKTIQNDTLTLKAITYKTELHSGSKQLDSAIIYSKKMLGLAERIKDTLFTGRANYKLGLYHSKYKAMDSAFYFYNESVKIFEHVNDSLYAGKALLNMSIILSDIGDFTESDQTAILALKFLKNLDKDIIKASAYNCLAINAKKQLDYQEALYWYDQALQTTERKKFKLIYLNNVANVYRWQGNYQKAIDIYEPLLNDSLIYNDPREKSRVLDNLSYAKWLMTGDQNLKDSFFEALEIRIKTNNMYGQIISNFHLAEFYKNLDLRKSQYHANQMYHISTDKNSIDDRLDALKLLMELYEGDLNKFKEFSGLYIQLNDSINQVRKKAKNQFAKIKYDSERNRAENSLLKSDGVQRQLALEKSNRLKTTYLSLGVLLLIIFTSAYFQIKVKNKKEKLQQVYDTETRIAKKVHDEVANDVYHLMIKLQNENAKEEILDDLEEIYMKTRDISKENSAIDFGDGFEVVLRDLLLNYKNDQVNVITRNLSKINWKTVSEIKKTAIYRVLQELMTNMKKHSNASLVILSFSKVKKKITIEYRDDGIGCEIKKSTGLQNAENRMYTSGGSINFESEINQGFKAKLTV